MKKPCNIVICGDICPTPDTEALFLSGDAKGLFKDLLDVFQQADLLIGNLEFPLTDIGKGVAKCGPVLKGKKECLSVLQIAGFNVLGLANNHIRDCGDEGVLSTLECCRNAGISTVGAGEDAAAAREPLHITVAGWRIGIIAFAEHEFNAASETQAGANLLDLFYSFDQMREVRAQCDYLVVLYHGGIEHYAYPSPMLQKKCRKMVESGADLVLCQHSHCIGTEEQHNDGTILYGQGNTVFGHRSEDPDWNHGLIVKVTLDESGPQNKEVTYLPILADKNGVQQVPPDKAEALLATFSERSKNINDNEFIKLSWQKFCSLHKSLYLPLLLGLGRFVNVANRKMNNLIIDTLFSISRKRITMNVIRCESHNEVIETILAQSIDIKVENK